MSNNPLAGQEQQAAEGTQHKEETVGIAPQDEVAESKSQKDTMPNSKALDPEPLKRAREQRDKDEAKITATDLANRKFVRTLRPNIASDVLVITEDKVRIVLMEE